MVKSITKFVAVCDISGTQLDGEFDSPTTAKQAAQDAGWSILNEHVLVAPQVSVDMPVVTGKFATPLEVKVSKPLGVVNELGPSIAG